MSEENQDPDYLPVDVAINDGGWMLLNREWKPEGSHLSRNPIDIILSNHPEFRELVLTA